MNQHCRCQPQQASKLTFDWEGLHNHLNGLKAGAIPAQECRYYLQRMTARQGVCSHLAPTNHTYTITDDHSTVDQNASRSLLQWVLVCLLTTCHAATRLNPAWLAEGRPEMPAHLDCWLSSTSAAPRYTIVQDPSQRPGVWNCSKGEI